MGDCEGYLDMTSTRVSTPSTSGTTSKSSTRYKIKTFNFKSNVDHCGQVKDSVKELSKLLSSLLHSQSKVLIFTTKNPTTFVFSQLHQLQLFKQDRSRHLLVQLQDHEPVGEPVEPAGDDEADGRGDERGRASLDQY